MNALAAPLASLLDTLPRLTLVAGKGGVGKTTIATGLAAHLSGAGLRTLLLSTDPASTLGDAIGVPLGPEVRAIEAFPRLSARQISAAIARDAFLARWRDVIVEIVDRGTYLDRDDIGGLVDTAFPGADEIFGLLELATAASSEQWQRIVVDTAPTGHTLRLLALPRTFEALIALLDSMQEKHRFMVRALTHRYRRDAADTFLEEMRTALQSLRATLLDPVGAAALLVVRAEPVVMAESERYADALSEAGVRLAAVIVNAHDEYMRVPRLGSEAKQYSLPRVAPPIGVAEAAALVSTLREAAEHERRDDRRSLAPAATGISTEAPSVDPAQLARELTFVGGKGGVGKTTVSCAIAIAAADAGLATLLVSTDPAPSVGDALAQPIGDAVVAIDDVPGLYARQMDATAAFARFRAEYESHIDGLFGALVNRGLDVAHDRAIMRDLLALAPPGIDEVYALSSLAEIVDEGRFARVIVDPAPTGHLLRLLEMPALALEWTHRLMRLMLKYKEVAPLGDAARDLLAFATRTRGLDQLLRDPLRAGLVLVTMDEPLVRTESARLARAVSERQVDLIATIWNRGETTPSPLPGVAVTAQLCAPLAAAESLATGVAAIRAWSRSWQTLSITPVLSTRDG